MHTYILLDRTGSMQSIWDEALNSINAYAKAVDAGDGQGGLITLAVFDAQDGLQFDLLRRSTPTATFTPVTNDEAFPRGMTPLFDAIGRMVSLAEIDSPKAAVLVIMTDGQENASRELTNEGAKVALDRFQARGWELVFLGAEFAKFSDADAFSIPKDKQMAMGAGSMAASMSRVAMKSRNYFQHGERLAMNDEDRAIANEDDVKKRKGS